MRSSLVRVRLGERGYPIHIGAGLLRSPSPWLGAHRGGRPVWIITDSHVEPLHAHALTLKLRRLGARVHVSVIRPGERAKSVRGLEALALQGLKAGLHRDSLLLAVGGGVVGDLAGLLAGTFLRGIEWIQVPTTLLAQVDASVGGKVAVNVGDYKNSLGLFLQPRAVVADVEVLRTLPAREFRGGLAEAIKMAAVLSRRDFAWLERRLPQFEPAAEARLLAELVRRCVRMKARVVEEDERDAGRRALLNFGHTLAHALEGQSGFRGLRHGEAVSVGCVFAARLSRELGLLAEAEEARLVGALRAAGLPTRPGQVSAARVLAWIGADKKQSAKGLAFVLTGPLGDGSVRRLIDSRRFRRALESFLRPPER